MTIEFKAWDRKGKKMLYPPSIPMQPGECDFAIGLSGRFTVKERSLLTVSMFPGMDFTKREPDDFELLTWIGLTTKDNKKIFPGDIISDKNGNKMTVGYGQYKGSEDSWGIKPTHFGCFITFEDGGVLALSQEGEGYSIASGACEHLGHSYEQ